MIERDHPKLAIIRQCGLLSISRSSYYQPPKGESSENLAIMDWSSRKVLSWRLSNTMDVQFCVEVLEEARTGTGARRSSTPTRAASSHTGRGRTV